MNLSLADVKAVADGRFKGPYTGYVFGLWSLTFILLLIPLVIMPFQWDQPSTYVLPDGQELKVDGQQVTINNTILEDTTPGQDKTIFIVVAIIAGLWYFAIVPAMMYQEYLKAKYRQAILEVWSRTKELPVAEN